MTTDPAMSPMNADRKNITRGYGLAVASAAILSTTAILIRYLTLTYRIPALVLAFWRDGLVAFFLLLILFFFRPSLLRIPRQQFSYVLAFGFVLSIFNALWILSVAMNGAAVSTVLVYSSAAFTALLGRWLLNEGLDWPKVAAVVFSFAGCVLVAEALDPAVWSTNLLGIIVGVTSGLLYAVYSLMGRSAFQRGLNPWTTVLHTFSWAAGFLLVFNLLLGGLVPGTAPRPIDLLWLGQNWAGWGVLLLLAGGPTLAGFGLYNMSLGYLPSSVVNLIATLEPPFTALIAYLLLGEHLTPAQLVGSLLILAGVVMLRIHEGSAAESRRREAAPPHVDELLPQ